MCIKRSIMNECSGEDSFIDAANEVHTEDFDDGPFLPQDPHFKDHIQFT